MANYFQDDFDADSTICTADESSDATSIASFIYAGYVANGCRYQSLREIEYWEPSDEKQFESMDAAHICHLILDSQKPKPLFHCPISENPKGIIDISKGSGIWAQEVAKRYTEAMVVV